MAEILIHASDTLAKTEIPIEVQHSTSYDIMHILRIAFYILVVVKLIQLSFLRRKKHNLKQRVYRKYLFSHQELLKQFTQQDKANMESTLSNTVKNASILSADSKSRTKKGKKRVSFTIEKNCYYEPSSSKIEEDDDLYKQIDENQSLIKLDFKESFEQQKIEDEFKEREQIIEINQKFEQICTDSSKMTQDTQTSQNEGTSQLLQISEISCESKESEKVIVEDEKPIEKPRSPRFSRKKQ